MATAPQDGTRILVAVRASEQGPAEVDVVRWTKPPRSAEACWVATDSDANFPVVYAGGELSGWMPLPMPLPPLRSRASAAAAEPVEASDTGEIDGSAI